jgi:DNA replication protein DnaC
MLSHTLKDKLKELKLSGMADTMQAREQLASERQLSPTEFLALLLDDEIERRNQSRLLRQEKEAGFESPKRLSQFDFSLAPTLPRSLVMEMASCQFITRKENWIIVGPTGVGKSHLSTAIGYEAIKQGMRVVSGLSHHLIADLIGSRNTPLYARRMKRLTACDLLILDDFGLRNFIFSGAEEVYELIRQRYEKGSILITTNRDPEEWPAVFGDGLIASAALDRLTHHATITIINEKSHRQRERELAQQKLASESQTKSIKSHDEIKGGR